MSKNAFYRLLDVRSLSDAGAAIDLAADAEALADIAERLKSIWRKVYQERSNPPRKGGVIVEGAAHAVLSRICVSSLEEFDEVIDEKSRSDLFVDLKKTTTR